MASIIDKPAVAYSFKTIGITITAMLAMISMIMSSTMVNVAIPDIMGAFGIGQDQAHWISTGFLSAMTSGMLLNAWLVTNFGPRNVFIGALTLFSVVAFAGQYAPTFEGIVMARIVQGLCAGLIQPLALTTVFLAYSPEYRGRAMGWFGMGVVFGPTIGPVLGGLIIDFAQWRYVFAAPVPIMFISAGMAWIYLPGRGDEITRSSFNLPSFVLCTMAIMLFLTGITTGQRDGWDTNPVFIMLIGSALSMISFLVRELRSKSPLLQLRLFQYRTYVASAIVGVVFGAGMFGSLYIVPVMVQTVQGCTALKAGLMLLPGGIVSMLIFPIAGQLSNVVRPYQIISVGLATFGVSCFFLSNTGILTSFWTMAWLVAFGRVGLGLAMPSLNLTAMGAVPGDLVQYAAGTLNFVRMTGAAIGVSTLAIIIENSYFQHVNSMLTTQTPDNAVTSDLLTEATSKLGITGLTDVERFVLAKAYISDLLTLQAFELAFREGHMALTVLFGFGVIITLILFRRA